MEKINSWKVACFRRRKSTTQNTTIHHESTTNSPRFTSTKHTKIRKTPC